MRQYEAIEKVVTSLKEESCVQSIFLKGSIGRNEHDQHSDIDLYCLVDEEEEKSFLSRRLHHLEAYKKVIFWGEAYIIAPQIIAVYEDMLPIDLFTVTKRTLQEKDYFQVLYDPNEVMKQYEATQHLMLPEEEFHECVWDMAWFLFRYHKAVERGNNDILAIEMLRHVMRNLTSIMLYRYAKNRSILGLKAIPDLLSPTQHNNVKAIYECITPSLHQEAVNQISLLIRGEMAWIRSQIYNDAQTISFLERMIKVATNN
ncbi:nucleotidyltransferase domain-containing protein [Pontibacillus litoralis]|uniref:DNA polymerase III subunit beta n=1 Tax=Pontibacillus litoralis JSM 072002 TaxID=1385512 RepID=A0A0A5FYA4_9BACI|nr:nucleotidyltransferase domain-containing protein [Pontibacillus litoralis]KGX84774.1 DNA polymerase III subunit beta [Pontibacillus litoralis JSM 072002]